jgi:hypothetical protein
MVTLFELVWPYRPDVLIRLDFLDWYHEVGRRYFPPGIDRLTPEEVRANSPFLTAAMQHPYFLQYSRKQRYRHQHFSAQDAQEIYSEGIAAFVTLMYHIQQHGFDTQHKIGVKRAIFLQRPHYVPPHRPIVRQRYYIGDGCHRLACLAWLGKTDCFPAQWFVIEYRLVMRPLNWFGRLESLGLLEAGDEQQLFELLHRYDTPWEWLPLITWTRNIRQRFQQHDIEALFAIKLIY